MRGAAPETSAPVTARLVRVAMIAFALLHLAQLASPLRLNTDAIIYLSLGHSVLRANDWTFAGLPTRFPPGYPLALAAAEWLGVLAPVSLFAANLACVAVALWCARALLGRQGVPMATTELALLLSLGSWVLVKHAPLPLTELPYMAASLVAVLLLEGAPAGGRARMAAAVASIAVAVSVRYVGLALLPALLWAVGGRVSRSARLGALALGLGGVAVLAPGRVTYVREALANYAAKGVAHAALAIVRDRLTEWGELLTNLPMSRFESARDVLFPLAGALAIGLVVRGRLGAARRIGATDVYLLSYADILLAWPYYDPRLWIPILPFFYAWLLSGIGRDQGGQPARLVYAATVLLLGLGALAFSLRLTLAGERFPLIYGNGSLCTAYQVAWGQRPLPDDLDAEERAAVALLLRLEPRARATRAGSE